MPLPALRLLLPMLLACTTVGAHPAIPPRVMLPVVYQGGLDVTGYLVSEKLDGVPRFPRFLHERHLLPPPDPAP
jgi:hypothetical protein